MRAAWSRWSRTKDATSESWEAAKSKARRCVGLPLGGDVG